MSLSTTQDLMEKQPSNPYYTEAPIDFSVINDMNTEAEKLLSQKKRELKAYKATIASAEEKIRELQSMVEERQSILSSIQFEDEEEIREEREMFERESQILEDEQRFEIQRLKEKHEEEMNNLSLDFQKTLSESENWSKRHAKIALQEKITQANQMKQEISQLKNQLNDTIFLKRSKPKNTMNEVQKKIVLEAAKLEKQISEITALTREEMRDSRTKIDECITAVELRKQKFAAEIRRLEDEYQKRNEKYEAHIKALSEQYSLEKSRIEQAITSANQKAEKTEMIIKQIEQHHDAQLSEVLNDIEQTRKSLTLAKSAKQSEGAMRSIVRNTQMINDKCKGVQKEISLINNELVELDDENRALSQELAKLQSVLPQ